jgi:hypothetical protein
MISHKFQFPVLVKRQNKEYRLRPLFLAGPSYSARRFHDAMAEFEGLVQREFNRTRLDRSNLDDMLWLSFNPDFRFDRWRLEFEIGMHLIAETFAAAWFDVAGQRFVCLPDFDSRLFLVPDRDGKGIRLSAMQSHAASLIKHLCQKWRADHPKDAGIREWFAAHRSEPGDHCTQAEAFLEIMGGRFPFDAGTDDLFALLGQRISYSGAEELSKVAQELNRLYPHRLVRARGRNPLVDRICECIFREENVPVVLVGPAGAGRTCVLHEALYRYIRDSEEENRDRLQKIWHLDPTRIISGMSRVGAWQKRFAAIMDHVKDRFHHAKGKERYSDRLFIDNMVALLRIGKTAQNSMTLSDVMKPYLEDRSFQVIGEATPEEWKVIQDLDRRFADLFQVIRVPPLATDDSIRVALHCRAQLERDHECRISTLAVSRVFDLQRAYMGRKSLPGAVVQFLEQLASRHRGGSVGVDEVNQSFQDSSRLQSRIFDRAVPLAAQDVRHSLELDFIGQREAVECLADLPASEPILLEIFLVRGLLKPRIVGLSAAAPYAACTLPHPPEAENSVQVCEAMLLELNRMAQALENAAAAAGGEPDDCAPLRCEMRDLKQRIQDKSSRLNDLLARVQDAIEFGRPVLIFKDHGTKVRGQYKALARWDVSASPLRMLCEALDARKYMEELFTQSPRLMEDFPSQFAEDFMEIGFMNHALRALAGKGLDRICIHIRSNVEGHTKGVDWLKKIYLSFLGQDRCWVHEPKGDADDSRGWGPEGGVFICAEGPGLKSLMSSEAGVHLFVQQNSAIVPVQVRVVEIPAGQTFDGCVREQLALRADWRMSLEDGTAEFPDDPWPAGRVLRIYDWNETEGKETILTDLRTGMIRKGPPPEARDWLRYLYEGLPAEDKPRLGGKGD